MIRRGTQMAAFLYSRKPYIELCGATVKFKGPTGNVSACMCMRVKRHTGKHVAMACDAELADRALLFRLLRKGSHDQGR